MDKRVYRGDFKTWDSEDQYRWESGAVVQHFELAKGTPEPEFIWAEYNGGSFDGSALVVFKQDGKWFQVYGSHCSCYGLEDQWRPEEFDPQLQFEALKEGKTLFAGYDFAFDEINAWLAAAIA